MIRLNGYIQGYDGESVTAVALFPSGAYLLEKQDITECDIILHDGREISPLQRSKIFALVSDITEYVSGYDKKKMAYNETLRQMQLNYLIDISPEEVRRQLTVSYCMLQNVDVFSLAGHSENTVDMSTARDFIDWLVELCIIHGIPCRDTLLNRCEDVGRYMYACVMNRRCCICGKKADIHEVEHVGSGRNRRKISHSGQLVEPLCRVHHNEVGDIGQRSFDEKYHIEAIRLDDAACEKLGWRL